MSKDYQTLVDYVVSVFHDHHPVIQPSYEHVYDEWLDAICLEISNDDEVNYTTSRSSRLVVVDPTNDVVIKLENVTVQFSAAPHQNYLERLTLEELPGLSFLPPLLDAGTFEVGSNVYSYNIYPRYKVATTFKGIDPYVRRWVNQLLVEQSPSCFVETENYEHWGFDDDGKPVLIDFA